MRRALETDGVAHYINTTERKKPVYLITGLLWTEGARLSEIHQNNNRASGQAVLGTYLSSGANRGGTAAYESDESLSSSFNGSSPFILGFRVRKIWWDKAGIRHDAHDLVGATLGESNRKRKSVLDGLNFVDDDVDTATGQILIDESLAGEENPVTWILLV